MSDILDNTENEEDSEVVFRSISSVTAGDEFTQKRLDRLSRKAIEQAIQELAMRQARLVANGKKSSKPGFRR